MATQQLPNPPGMNPPGTPVTKEEQKVFQELELNAMKIIFQEPKITDRLLSKMEEFRGEPAKAVGLASKMVVDEATKNAGKQKVLPEMITRVSNKVVGAMSQLGATSGLFELDDTSKKEALQFVLGDQVKTAVSTEGGLNPDALMNFTVGHAKRANQMKLRDQDRKNKKKPPVQQDNDGSSVKGVA